MPAISRDRICDIGIVIGCAGFGPDVDHIIRAEIYTAKHHGVHINVFDPANLQGYCHACHNHKTSLED